MRRLGPRSCARWTCRVRSRLSAQAVRTGSVACGQATIHSGITSSAHFSKPLSRADSTSTPITAVPRRTASWLSAGIHHTSAHPKRLARQHADGEQRHRPPKLNVSITAATCASACPWLASVTPHQRRAYAGAPHHAEQQAQQKRPCKPPGLKTRQHALPHAQAADRRAESLLQTGGD